ncbi:NAD-dependent histone deacetylase HST3, partial [Nosema granulosis]
MLLMDNIWIQENIKKFYKRKVVFITGAGISVSSGIPDFRSKNGIFEEIKSKYKVNGVDLFSYRFSIDPKTRSIYLEYISKLKKLVDSSKPSFSHFFFKYFSTRSKKFRVYSQNIDSLEEKAGLFYSEDSETKLVYLHGDLKYLRCINCGNKEDYIGSGGGSTTNTEFKEIFCRSCSTPRKNIPLHTNIIHYYQDHPYSDLISKCIQKDTGCNLLVVVGTRLDVFGVKNMVRYFRKTSRNLLAIFVNPEPPKKEIEYLFDFHYPGKSDDFFLVVLRNIEEYKMLRRIKRLSIFNEEDEKAKEEIEKQLVEDKV